MNSINKNIIIIFSLLLNGCSSFMSNAPSTHFTSEVNLKNFKLNQSLSKEMISFIQNYYPRSTTTFYFQLDPSAYAQGNSIENALRKVGYGVSYIKKEGRIPFAYKIDFIDKGLIRATYNIGESTLSRLYQVNGKSLNPISNFTTRGFKKALYRSKVKSFKRVEHYSNYKKAIVTISTLRVRNRPSKRGKVIGKYHKNSLIYVEDPIINNIGKSWSRVIERDSHGQVVYSNNGSKYIASKYLNYLN